MNARIHAYAPRHRPTHSTSTRSPGMLCFCTAQPTSSRSATQTTSPTQPPLRSTRGVLASPGSTAVWSWLHRSLGNSQRNPPGCVLMAPVRHRHLGPPSGNTQQHPRTRAAVCATSAMGCVPLYCGWRGGSRGSEPCYRQLCTGTEQLSADWSAPAIMHSVAQAVAGWAHVCGHVMVFFLGVGVGDGPVPLVGLLVSECQRSAGARGDAGLSGMWAEKREPASSGHCSRPRNRMIIPSKKAGIMGQSLRLRDESCLPPPPPTRGESSA